jgi:PiT family inorganic phosphate transporter
VTARVIAVIAGLALAALLGVSDSPNASAALLAARAGPYPMVVAWSALWHLLGGLLAGSAVAVTIIQLLHVAPHLLASTLAAGCLASVAFTWIGTRRGVPASASVGLVGGLAGAGLAANGWHGVEWASAHGVHLAGVAGVVVGLLLAPILGTVVAGALDHEARRAALHLARSTRRPLRAAVWVTSAAVGFTGGANDAQKAMAVLAIAASGTAALGAHSLAIPTWDRIICASVLAAATALGGRRVVANVARGLARDDPIDALAAQSSSAAVIVFAGALGLPLSTSSVVSSGMIGAGLAHRRHHVRWAGVVRIFAVWALTLPGCAVIGAALEFLWRIVG